MNVTTTEHEVTIEPVLAPDRQGWQALARCTCGWAEVSLFTELAEATTRNHLSRVVAVDEVES